MNARAGGRDGSIDFCPEGCYWACEHGIPAGRLRGELTVADRVARPPMCCAECGDYLHDVVGHAREHERMRQLGWLSEHLPARPPPG